MVAEDVLRESESGALNNNRFVSHVTGKTKIKPIKKIKSLGVMGFLTAGIIMIVVLLGSGNLIPSAISERLIEETDVQYADAVESKKIVFQQALKNGEIPEDTASILKDNGVLTGCDVEGEFKETNKCDGGLILKMGEKRITADNFINIVSTDSNLYGAFNNATYGRAAYYYDDSAKEVFRKIGTSRNNYSKDIEFNEVMDSLMGSGSDIDVNSVSRVRKEKINEDTKEKEVYYEYVVNGEDINSKNDTNDFISGVLVKNPAGSKLEATLNSADALKIADTMSKEQRSSLFFALFMENISKMKAGEGGESKINDAMNFLYQNSESEVVDVETGELVKISGTPLDSPSLYAILAGNEPNNKSINNYSSDRILKTVENRLGNNNGSVTSSAVVSTSKSSGTIGRYIGTSKETGEIKILNLVSPTVDKSLKNNSYETIKGVNAGEFLVEGAINVGKELAKASGGAAGDQEAVMAYSRLNSEILAMDAKVERKNKNPFDITSRNTFLGSIVYNLAVSLKNISGDSYFTGIKTLAKATYEATNTLLPATLAESEENYLTKFGDCETYEKIGAVGSLQCAEIATFDTSTLDDPFNDPGFIDFVEKNTTLSASGSRTVNKNSDLSDYILYNNERITPLGVIDGGILDSLDNSSITINFTSNILKMVQSFIGTSDSNKNIASGAAFVNSKINPKWQTYKYAQRYVSLARATATLRQYAGDSKVYDNIAYFEGNKNPVVAFLEEYYLVASENK